MCTVMHPKTLGYIVGSGVSFLQAAVGVFLSIGPLLCALPWYSEPAKFVAII